MDTHRELSGRFVHAKLIPKPVTNECSVLLPSGLAKKKPLNTCAARKCNTKLTALKITCSDCKRDFCSTHRFPRDHLCKGVFSIAPSSTNRPRSSSKSGLAAIAPIRNLAAAASRKASSSSKPVLIEIPSDSDSDAEFIRTERVVTRSQYKPVSKAADSDSDVELVSSSKPRASTKVSSLLNVDKLSKENRQTSKRAKEERKSQLRALSVRASKGLLSESEKVEYATLRAMEAKGGKSGKQDDDNCLIL